MKKHILFLCTILTHSTSVKAEVPHAEKILPLRIQNPPIPFPSPPSVTVYGYHAYWTGDPMDIDLSPLSHIAIFNVDLNADGTLADTQRWTSVAPDIVEKAHGMGVKVHLCLTSFYDSINNTVLPDASKRATAISELTNLVNAYGADGVNIDIEGMDEEQRENLNLFVQELRPHVDEIFLATPAVDWTDAYDYETLAANSDGLFIMG
ncbi:MAG: glycosyl hydrolase family 18 protein, partial [Myxococcota bacterium]|nr:glycosyl hydrolase family 18 protein [Myxococcota bacterium]